MGDRVELAFRRAAQQLIPDRTPLLAAVSGGADSVALLHLLHRLAPTRGIEITVAHLDHGLRRGSVTDRRFVERLARELGLDCIGDRREVETLRRRDESPEEAARRVRRAFLVESAAKSGCRWIAMGHTLDDQAETVLMRLVRGAGASALAGMAARGPGPFLRPLLAIEGADLRSWLKKKQRSHREDPSNRDLRFDRNRVRRLVLPVLKEQLNPRAARHIVGAAGRLREDSEHLDTVAEAAFRRVSRTAPRGALVLDANRLARLDPVVGRRVARLALRAAGADARRVGTRHIETLLDLARGGGGRRANLPGGMEARRDGSRVFLKSR